MGRWCAHKLCFLLKLWRRRGQHGALGVMQPPVSVKDVGRGTRGNRKSSEESDF